MGVKPFPIGNAVASLHSLSGVKPFPIGNAVASLQKLIFLNSPVRLKSPNPPLGEGCKKKRLPFLSASIPYGEWNEMGGGSPPNEHLLLFRSSLRGSQIKK